MRLRFLRKHARLRLLPLYAAVLALWAFARPSPWSLALGALGVVAGLALRAWGAGHLVKTDRLAASGPYARMRHPLYAGSLLIGLGLGASAGGVAGLAVAGVGLPFFLLYYLPYKERIESARLERRHGAHYAEYRARVPALLPSRTRFAGGAAQRWSPARYRANHEAGTALATLGVLAAIALRPVLPF